MCYYYCMNKRAISALPGTPFQKKVWQEVAKIPRGSVMTYKTLAKRIGKPKAIRAVANAVGANPKLEIIPCHRVIRSDGALGGYSGKDGVAKKRKLLQREGVIITFTSNRRT